MTGTDARGLDGRGRELRDFTADRRVLLLASMAVLIGAVACVIALALVKLISLITNLAFYGRLSTQVASPADNHLGMWVVLVPVAGALVIGVMARFGSEKIRGHGIPEALEAILIGQSTMEAKVATLKPLSSAISIGTGGPFGAEGPIIMTGGAFGSLFAQFFHLSAAERKTLLVAGAAAGMAAIFGTPVAAVLLAVELLLFEWKPRSFIPVATACAVAAALRPLFFDGGALFLSLHPPLPSYQLIFCLVLGVSMGLGSAALTLLVYGFEDAFERLPIHWMWWPALGGLAIGIGGFIDPHALGIGYESIRMLLSGRLIGTALVSLLVVKTIIWSVSLGSGTSGGVLAPLLIIGGALGALASHLIPSADPGFWAMVGMGAMVAGTMRSPLTAIVFMVELTHDVNALLPLLAACTAAFATTVLLMRRSILTEKIARHGHHVTREYSVDHFDVHRVSEILSTEVLTLEADLPVGTAIRLVTDAAARADEEAPHAFPVVESDGRAIGMVTRGDVLRWGLPGQSREVALRDVLETSPFVVAHAGETVGVLADRMATEDVGRVPVIDDDGKLVGTVSRRDILLARSKRQSGENERRRVRSLRKGPRTSSVDAGVESPVHGRAAGTDPPDLT